MASAQQPFHTDSVGPERFIAAHGRKAIVMGNASTGLEVWAYPLQLIGDYEPAFRAAGDTTETAGSSLLREITYEPAAITRTYIGPDFIVSERLFVPLDQAVIFLTYRVECRHSLDIIVHFAPVLNLMWPASLGGQSTQWSAPASAYLLSDGTQKYAAWIGSPAIIAHDEVHNSASAGSLGNRLAFAVRAGGAIPSATVVVANAAPGPAAGQMQQLLRDEPNLEAESARHYHDLAAHSLRIVTPDEQVNQQLAWAQTALDQAWVCNPVLGCGMVAGYGPSRNARRPQYDWFFAGDGLIATDALLSEGEYTRAREELDFIAKYQDARTGMIWHELSQSADPADWAAKYPYMFVHVDITFQYLGTLARYVDASGDTQYLQQHWSGIAAAYRYCQSLLDPKDGLPRIPSNKLGGDEQDKITEDLDLSVSWVTASAAFARMARLNGHAAEAEQAAYASNKARNAAASHYWSDAQREWFDGYNATGQPIQRRGSDGVQLATAHIVDQPRSDLILGSLASSDFQTDWGSRGVGAHSAQFDPSSYAAGSVSALGTAGIAAAFWKQHQPLIAYQIWRGLLPWGTLDSMGHMHEVAAGDFYHQQTESVPEQTWSSAGFLSSTIYGLLGLSREAEHLRFAPHLPSAWDKLFVDNIQGNRGSVSMTVSRVAAGMELDADNSGGPVDLLFAPEIPLGATVAGAECNGKSVPVKTEDHTQDTHASLTLQLASGKTKCQVRYRGGISLSVNAQAPRVGQASGAIKIASVAYHAASLVLTAEVFEAADIEMRTSQKPIKVQGATIIPGSTSAYYLRVDPSQSGYKPTRITIDFAPVP